MKILKVSDVYFPRVNGVSTSIQTFSEDLITLGHEVALVAPAYGKGTTSPECRRVPARAVPGDPEDRVMSWRALNASLAALPADIDAVHIHTPFLAHYAGVRFARARRIPVVATYHTLFEEYLHHYVPILPRALTRPAARWFSREQCNQLDAIVAPSKAMREALLEYGVRKPITILPTGLPASRFAAGNGAEFRRRHGIAQGRPLLLFVGRAAHEKNIDFLLRMLPGVLRKAPEALLLIAGEGPAVAALKRVAAGVGVADQVRFLGYFDRNTELLDCYAAADVFVFASLTETQGLVLLEAMAQGVPVVAIARMGTIDILEPQRGCRQAPANETGFAQVVARVLSEEATRKRLGEEARIYANEWSSAAQARRLAEIYTGLCLGNEVSAAALPLAAGD